MFTLFASFVGRHPSNKTAGDHFSPLLGQYQPNKGCISLSARNSTKAVIKKNNNYVLLLRHDVSKVSAVKKSCRGCVTIFYDPGSYKVHKKTVTSTRTLLRCWVFADIDLFESRHDALSSALYESANTVNLTEIFAVDLFFCVKGLPKHYVCKREQEQQFQL